LTNQCRRELREVFAPDWPDPEGIFSADSQTRDAA
jgi:hypothetical protein